MSGALRMYGRDGKVVYDDNDPQSFDTGGLDITINSEDGPPGNSKQIGYGGFYTTFFFNGAGRLVGQGSWE